MSDKRSIDSRRSRVQEINRQVDSARSHVETLREDKRRVLDDRTAISEADIDEGVRAQVVSEMAQALRHIDAMGQETHDSLDEGFYELAEIEAETREEISENEEKKQRVERVQGLLGVIGMDGVLNGAVGKMESHGLELHELLDESIESMRGLEDVSSRATHL